MSKCIVSLLGANHSTDLVTVYHGYATPTTACGHHAHNYPSLVFAARANAERGIA